MNSSGQRGLTLALLTLTLFATLFPQCQPAEGKKITYRRLVTIGLTRFQFGRTCVLVGGQIKSGDFFSGLVKVSIAGSYEFRKHSQSVRTFPDDLDILLRATLSECEATSVTPPQDPVYKDLMRSLRIEIAWKSGSGVHWMEHLTARVKSAPLQQQFGVWNYEVTVPSKDQSIDDQLVVVLKTEDGKTLGTIEGGL